MQQCVTGLGLATRGGSTGKVPRSAKVKAVTIPAIDSSTYFYCYYFLFMLYIFFYCIVSFYLFFLYIYIYIYLLRQGYAGSLSTVWVRPPGGRAGRAARFPLRQV